MKNPITSQEWQRPFLVLASAVLVTASLYWGRHILIPVALAVLLTFTLGPLVSALQKLRLGRVPAVLVVMLLTSLLIVGIGIAVFHQAEMLVAELPQHKDEIVRKITSVQEAGRGSVFDTIGTLVRDVRKTLETKDAGQTPPGKEPPVPVTVEEGSPVWSYAASLAEPIIEPLIEALLVVVLTGFMLVKREDLRNRMIRLWSHGGVTRMTRALDDAAQRISRFLFMQAFVNVFFGLTVGLGLWLIAVPYALLWGLLATVLRYIPYLGIWVAALFPVVLSLAIFPDWARPLVVLGFYVGLDLVISNVAEPRLYGQSVGVSEVALLVAVAFWGWLWGPIGLVLATPLTACLLVLGRHLPQLEFLNVLLGDEPALPTHVSYYQRLLARDEDEAADLVEKYSREHPNGQVYADVLLPALVLAKYNRERGELNRTDERFLLRATREIVDEVKPAVSAGNPEETSEGPSRRVTVFGCPARDEFDEVALRMFKNLIESPRCRFKVLSTKTLSAEVVAKVLEEGPALVCIAALPPERLAHTRYLCKRLRGQFPDLKIFVGCWGLKERFQRAVERLEEAGADSVATLFEDTRCQLLPLIQVQAAKPASAPVPTAGK